MDQVLAGLRWQILVLYVDDAVVAFGDTFEDHLRALNVVFDRIQKWGLRLAVAKCQFFLKESDYLGYMAALSQEVSPRPRRTSPRFYNWRSTALLAFAASSVWLNSTDDSSRLSHL